MSAFVEPVSIALLHFLWQGLGIALALALLLRFTRRSSANARYALGVAALALMALLPVLTVTYAVAQPTTPAAPWVDVERSDPVSGTTSDVSSAALATSGGSFAIANLRGWIVALWLAGVSAFAFVQAGGWLRLKRLRDSGISLADSHWQRWVDDACRQLGIRRPVTLLGSLRLDAPLMMGWIRPAIVVPAAALTGMCPRSLEALLLHELAHVRRHDFLVNSLQAAVETVLFYHPAVWWVSRQVRREREHCCDDLALSLCGSRRHYVQALADMETLRHAPPTLALAADGGSLVERIRRLTVTPSARNEVSPRWTVGLVVLALLGAAAAIQVASSSVAMAEPAAQVLPAAVVTPMMIVRDSDTVEGTWTARTRKGEIWIELRTEDRRSQNSFTLIESDFSGTGNDGIPGFDLIRDAGTIAFQGSLQDGDRKQRFTFHPNPVYASRMQELGFEVSDKPHKLFKLAALDVSYEFAEGIRNAGYGHISMNRLTEFRIHGVTPEFVRGMAESGFEDLDAARLVEFRIHGISPEFVRGMAESGFEDLSAARLVEFRIHGISPEFVRGMAESGLDDLSASRLVEFRIHGVSGEFVQEMTRLDIEDMSPSRLVEMRIHGVSVEYARRAQERYGSDLTAGDLVEMRIHGRQLD